MARDSHVFCYNFRMNHYDIIWGEQTITDPQILKIIKHPALQRLKNIWVSTYGYLFDLKRNSTRFEHSVGVYLLLKHFNASKEEQIAGLVHDISHTALSHVSTYAFQGKYSGTEFHELQQKRFFEDSGLAKLLEKLGFNPNDLLHEDHHTLLENELPDICADRLDYALRDGMHLQILSRQQVETILKGLKVHKDEFVFKNIESAFLYSFNFYLLNLMFYGSAIEAHFNNDFGSLVKLAIKEGVLAEKDWFTDDVFLTNKLKKSKNKKVVKWLEKYNNKLVIYENSEKPDVVFSKKIRIVDPKVLQKGKLVRLSELSIPYNKIITDYKRTHKKHELPINIVYKK